MSLLFCSVLFLCFRPPPILNPLPPFPPLFPHRRSFASPALAMIPLSSPSARLIPFLPQRRDCGWSAEQRPKRGTGASSSLSRCRRTYWASRSGRHPGKGLATTRIERLVWEVGGNGVHAGLCDIVLFSMRVVGFWWGESRWAKAGNESFVGGYRRFLSD